MPRLRLISPVNPLNHLMESDIARRVTFGRRAVFMPLGLAVAAAVVPRSWQVEIIDECVRPVRVARDVDLVGITAMTCQAPRAYELADAYRRLGVPVILGGIHPSGLPEEALGHAAAVAVGEAEGTLPRMIADFEAGRLGGVYRAEGAVEIAAPRRDLLDKNDYLVWNAVQISRGCPHRCRFCTTHAMYEGRYAMRPPDAICEEIRGLGARRVIFADDNVVGHPRWAREFYTELAKLKVGWCGQATITAARDPELLHLMKRSGCLGLIVGLESHNPESLRLGNKTYCHPDEYMSLLRRMREARIGTWGSFLLGFDCDTVGSLRETVAFARRARLGITCYPILTPYPGTPLYGDYESQGRILTKDWSKYNGTTVVFRPARMTPRELANCQMAAFREFYSWPSMWERLDLWPPQKWAWIINASINQGFAYYYRRQKKQMPDFREAHQWEAEVEVGAAK
ncbi:MAG: B12-binding domain-containing radical SAM protein [Planctomycetes bacterium]|nr:B12-binding domain-containing radical SAM protein [Planctomycetota bacterium]